MKTDHDARAAIERIRAQTGEPLVAIASRHSHREWENERDERRELADLHFDRFRSRRNSFASPLDGVTNIDYG